MTPKESSFHVALVWDEREAAGHSSPNSPSRLARLMIATPPNKADVLPLQRGDGWLLSPTKPTSSLSVRKTTSFVCDKTY